MTYYVHSPLNTERDGQLSPVLANEVVSYQAEAARGYALSYARIASYDSSFQDRSLHMFTARCNIQHTYVQQEAVKLKNVVNHLFSMARFHFFSRMEVPPRR